MKSSLKILHVSTSDASGGAARSAFRIHAAQVAGGLDSSMLVLHKETEAPSIKQAASRNLTKHFLQKLFLRWHKYRRRGWSTDNLVLHSFGEDSGGLVGELNSCDADILNLHWISNTLSIRDIGRLRKPVVWTLHDMWPFCGGEHYAPDGEDARFRCGYHADNRPKGERGPDLNRRSWEAKRDAWAKQSFTIVSPSHWLARCCQQSVLFSKMPLHVIKYPIDTDVVWKPLSRNMSRTILGLPMDKKLILFGAQGGIGDLRKGGDLLYSAVLQMAEHFSVDVELLIYGQERTSTERDWPYPVHWLGVVNDDQMLARAYSAADVMVVPSRQDNLPNTAIEAQACGTPVAAFNIGGLPDIVDHKETGWLAKAFDTKDLAQGISWVLDDEERYTILSANARKQATQRYSEQVIARTYGELYEQVLSEHVQMI